MTDPGHTKQTVIAYLTTAYNDKRPAEAVEKYGGSHYTQHNPQAPDGFDAFIQFVEGFVEQFPQLSLDIKRAVAEDDLVVTHSLLKTSPEDRGTAVADIFRLEDGRVVEHWDVLQPVPESAANDDLMASAEVASATPSGAPSPCRPGTPPRRCVPGNVPRALSPRVGSHI